MIGREERVYDREAVLGRDTRSVFPSESATLGKMDPDAAAAVMGSMQFVTESQVAPRFRLIPQSPSHTPCIFGTGSRAHTLPRFSFCSRIGFSC